MGIIWLTCTCELCFSHSQLRALQDISLWNCAVSHAGEQGRIAEACPSILKLILEFGTVPDTIGPIYVA